MDTESAVQRCPRCRTSFHVMADEAGMHACPRCGFGPDDLIGPQIECRYCGEEYASDDYEECPYCPQDDEEMPDDE